MTNTINAKSLAKGVSTLKKAITKKAFKVPAVGENHIIEVTTVDNEIVLALYNGRESICVGVEGTLVNGFQITLNELIKLSTTLPKKGEANIEICANEITITCNGGSFAFPLHTEVVEDKNEPNVIWEPLGKCTIKDMPELITALANTKLALEKDDNTRNYYGMGYIYLNENTVAATDRHRIHTSPINAVFQGDLKVLNMPMEMISYVSMFAIDKPLEITVSRDSKGVTRYVAKQKCNQICMTSHERPKIERESIMKVLDRSSHKKYATYLVDEAESRLKTLCPLAKANDGVNHAVHLVKEGSTIYACMKEHKVEIATCNDEVELDTIINCKFLFEGIKGMDNPTTMFMEIAGHVTLEGGLHKNLICRILPGKS